MTLKEALPELRKNGGYIKIQPVEPPRAVNVEYVNGRDPHQRVSCLVDEALSEDSIIDLIDIAACRLIREAPWNRG